MLADKFNRYKLLLVASVSSAVVFHTLLLHVDARVSPNSSPLRNVTEIPSVLYCGRTGAIVRLLGNESCPTAESEKWVAHWTPSDCQLLAECNQQQQTRMRLCSPLGNCTQIATKSTLQLEVELVLEVVSTDNKDTCTAQIVSLHTDQIPVPSTLLCNCLIQCPLMLMIPPELPADHEMLNATDNVSVIEESDRLKHNRGFWIYFFLRILASGSLATSFSMYVITYIAYSPSIIVQLRACTVR